MNDWQLLQKEFDAEQLPVGTRAHTQTANLGSGVIIGVEKGVGLLAPRYSVRWDKTQEVGKVSASFFTKEEQV